MRQSQQRPGQQHVALCIGGIERNGDGMRECLQAGGWMVAESEHTKWAYKRHIDGSLRFSSLEGACTIRCRSYPFAAVVENKKAMTNELSPPQWNHV
jgi:hypothetical protein